MEALQITGVITLGCFAAMSLLYGEIIFLRHSLRRNKMLKIKLCYDLPEYDPEIHDPDKVFRLLTYRGVSYAKWVFLKSRGTQNWKIF